MSDTSTSQKEFSNRLSGLMEANLENESFGVSELAREMGMSRSNLHRKVNSILNISASQFIREFRLEKAKELLHETSFTVSEITYKVGFGSTSYFIKCFREHFGYTPGDSENHNETKEQPQKRIPWLKPVTLDKSDLIVWSLVFIVLLNVFFIVIWPRIKSSPQNGKTIAIMHFVDLTPSADKSYIINGLREDILDNLSSVNNLKTVSEVLIDQYLNTDLSAIDVAKKTKADYLLTAKGETSDNNTTLWFTLTETNSGNQIWREKRSLSISNYFDLRKEIAYAVATRLKADLTEEEKENIEKIPTKNMTAYNKFLLGEEYLNLSGLNASFGNGEKETLIQKAKLYFENAVQLDSTFSDAYVRLGHIYISNLSFTSNFRLSEQYMDSGLVMAEKAIHYDEKNSWAYGIINDYYLHKGDITKANEFYNKAVKFSARDDEDWFKYSKNFWRAVALRDSYQAIENFYRYKQIKPDGIRIIPNELNAHIDKLNATGFPEISQKAALEILNFDNDSAYFYRRLWKAEMYSGNFDAGRNYVVKSISFSGKKSVHFLYDLLLFYFYTKDFNQASDCFNLILQILNENEFPYQLAYEPGYIYLVLGKKEKAKSYFNKSISEIQKEIELNRPHAQIYETHFRLASIYSALNQKDKAIEYLVQLKKRDFNDVWLVTRLKYSPMLDNIRNEPEFAEVLKDVETKYQKEHEKIGELLRKYGELE